MTDYIQCGKCGCSMPFYANMVYPVTWGGRPVCGNCRKELEGDLGKELKKDICPECLESRPDDERVKNGMKCFFCSYGIRLAKPEMSAAEIDYADLKSEDLSDADESDARNEGRITIPKEKIE